MTEPYTPETVPPDTDKYIYRPVTTWRGDMGAGAPEVVSELRQIWISQP